MKKIYLIILILLFSIPLFAKDTIKVVRNIQTGEIVYRQEPAFEDSKGIVNAVILKGGNPSDYEETKISQEEWDEQKIKPEQDKENEKKEAKTRIKQKLNLSEQDFADLRNALKSKE